MQFHTFDFFIFLFLVAFFFWRLPSSFRATFLLLSSYVFYSWEIPKYLVLIIFLSLLSYLSGLLINKYREYSRFILVLSISGSLGVLCFFKYADFFEQNLGYVFDEVSPFQRVHSYILPAGISFYTFQAISYIVDVYRGKKIETSFIKFSLYISFFPQLIAGPIERSENMLSQFYFLNKIDLVLVTRGLRLILWGLLKKILVADQLALFADVIFEDPYSWGAVITILGILAFSFQIYFDFSAYSDMAIGIARVFGVKLSKNFCNPYFAVSLRDFWSRWHISLSQWIRDYIYISLGGGRKRSVVMYRNILLSFLLSGFWHGAGWNFILWGGIHGVVLCIEKLIGRPKKFTFISVIKTFLIVSFAWIFFRAASFSDAIDIIHVVFDGLVLARFDFNNLYVVFHLLNVTLWECLIVLILLISMLTVEWFSERVEIQLKFERYSTFVRWFLYCMSILVLLFYGFEKPATFIYFKF